MTTMDIVETLVVMRCWCGLTHAVPENAASHHWRTGRELYCPLGHSYIPSDRGENAQLRKKVAELEESRNRIRARLTDTERSLTATKGHLTRQQRRHTAGVCAVCHRSFQQVRRHMERMHPEVKP